MHRLDNKVAIVTGAAHGIGRTISEAFAAEGAYVVLADIDQLAGDAAASAIRSSGGRADFVLADVTSSQDIERAVNVATLSSGHIDILVNNAAHLGDWLDANATTADQWDHSFATTLKSAALLTKAVLPGMVEQKNGSIINVASVQGLRAGRSSAAYTSMKHALIGLTRSTAADFGPHGIRANAICPGAVTTRISPEPGSELYDRQVAKTMLGRVGQPHEVAAAAVFLASYEASYVTGVALPVDGGWTAF